VFEVRSVKGLSELLPKLSKYKNPPYVEKEHVNKYFVSDYYINNKFTIIEIY